MHIKCVFTSYRVCRQPLVLWFARLHDSVIACMSFWVQLAFPWAHLGGHWSTWGIFCEPLVPGGPGRSQSGQIDKDFMSSESKRSAPCGKV